MKIKLLICLLFSAVVHAQTNSNHNLVFDSLAKRWDDGMPLGNGMLGALIWQRGDKLHVSLDRADLWDERPALDLSRFNFKWVQQQVAKNKYDTVQKLGDEPYEASPYPTKIPAGALEFDISSFGKVVSNVLDISNAYNSIKFENGTVCNIYVHAQKNVGYFGFENLPAANVIPDLIIPAYTNNKNANDGNSVEGQGLQKLGYAKGNVDVTDSTIIYHQPTFNNNYYEILVQWKKINEHHIIGAWTIVVNENVKINTLLSNNDEPTGWSEHQKWWSDFWNKSSVTIPDKILEKQYYLELYKLGCVARKGAPAITLQAIWTADNGNLPPWKGDFHNDLNTQLSYWPCYTSNHLEEAATFTDWLWNIKEENKKYTKQYFGVGGLNVPGVVTLHGYAMGGWIQYSLSPTVGAWLAQHFYWQWKYSMDKKLLMEKVYPYIHDVATYLENISYLENGKRKIPLSSSPEYHDNNINAWFTNWTNYDLSLAKFLFKTAKEVCDSANKKKEAKRWIKDLNELPGYAVNQSGLEVAAGENFDESHRHMSPYMSIYPLGLLNIENANDKIIIENSLKHIREKGTGEWCGYSFSWMACMYARTKNADSAAKMLQIFASNFCGINSFHLNGDQKGGQYSHFTYRPFTLEGNFAFAQGLQEMLIHSHLGYIEVLPATPLIWKDIFFENFRTEGAFLVSVNKKNGVIENVKVFAEQNGLMKIKLPFKTFYLNDKNREYELKENILSVQMNKNETVIINNGYE
jgi:alpha-L-fucosidase 2